MIEHLTAKGLLHTPTFAQVLVATAARTVYTSGQVSIDEARKLVGPGDLDAQTTQAMKNLWLALESDLRRHRQNHHVRGEIQA